MIKCDFEERALSDSNTVKKKSVTILPLTNKIYFLNKYIIVIGF